MSVLADQFNRLNERIRLPWVLDQNIAEACEWAEPEGPARATFHARLTSGSMVVELALPRQEGASIDDVADRVGRAVARLLGRLPPAAGAIGDGVESVRQFLQREWLKGPGWQPVEPALPRPDVPWLECGTCAGTELAGTGDCPNCGART